MVTEIHKGKKPHLYMVEWREKRGISADQIAARLEVSRQTVHRWEREQHRMDPGKQAAYAYAIGVEPEQLWYPPERPSIDALLAEASDDLREKAAEMVRILLRTGT